MQHLVEDMAAAALRDVATWGRLEVPVRIVLHPDHEALERAIGRHGLPWLRAWAQYSRIDLQSPATFGYRDPRPALRELLAHELTHVWMYQHIGTPETWSQVWVPFWFREGMASWTSKQGYRRGNLASLGQRLAALDGAIDPLLDGETLTRIDQPLAYGAAHWGFDRVVAETGEDAVRALLEDLRSAVDCAPPANPPAGDEPQRPVSGDGRTAQTRAGSGTGDVDCSSESTRFGRAFEHRLGESEVLFAIRFRRDLLEAAHPSPTAEPIPGIP
ncbi:MAG: hypothetical protein ABIJ09_10070 [Pseudomonadota bacterium]